MSRDSILAKIDAATQTAPLVEIDAQASALIADPDSYRADFAPQPLIARFIEKATSETVTATVEQLASLADIPAAVSHYLTEKELGAKIAVQPRACLRGIDWSGVQITDHAQMNEPIALTIADAGIAETGSLVFFTGPDAPVLLNFLPLHHLAVLRSSTIRPYMEDVFDAFGTTRAKQGRSCNIITGTSGTADIEARNVRGAHGPRFMHILLISE
ncbi:hypothetical protein CEP88_10750 [Roseobacter denitrificans]|uniref:LUD domain-containing protein n=1 Tax=Roseobacter denitrificans (strain ATCC 33942 / OCh 114) TaxID=375451 RepID=Q16DY6_ROSDO|nr:LUD domain-containing protein [Roseobacter denitrificans]ABG29807.1 conserved hypothetical protein [Roseobacter denitrificans OCh 114]AVL53032.1 hypothetical protein CEP88_10750 [Roseobacter denitrificans]SFG26695.1 L-lactate dehydrogenase complex protein LldG [Roseobacter denitrificans OCh 114]